MSSEADKSVPRRRVPFVECFDALWFCYSPVHQMQQYYRVGKLDNCSEKWNALIDCFTLKTKRDAEVQKILQAREKEKPHIWTFRTPEEASVQWKRLFGHLDREWTCDHGFTTAAAAEDFTPIVLIVQPGEDIIQKISSLMTQFTGAITVLTAIGDISSVVLGHPSCTGVSMRIEGSFQIITLSGSISSSETGILVSNNERFRVLLAKPDGETFGGAITGPLIADTPIQLVLGNLSQNNGRELRSSSTAAARDSI